MKKIQILFLEDQQSSKTDKYQDLLGIQKVLLENNK